MDSGLDHFSEQIPAPLAQGITAQQRALAAQGREDAPYRIEQRGLPAPVWARRGLPDDGSRAWALLQEELKTAPAHKAFCIYVHIPFCDSRCEFCDCYAFALRRNREIHTGRYTDLLLQEMDLWAAQGNLAGRPVTTVHLGGGTPTMLGAEHLGRLVQGLRRRFAVDARTEWALETTSSSLDEPMFAALQELGFTRLHIGVQSLQDEVRSAIGRRESGAAVVEKISRAVSLGWVVSVDSIVGLPGQTPQGLLDDLNRLNDCGVEGLSIYELQHSRRNHRFFEKHRLLEQPAEQRYRLFQLAFQHLQAGGYTKNVFNHLAKGRDQNLYFTFPQRGEDLLALGAIADGSFGNYHYRHPEYLPYTRQATLHNPGLQGGLRRTPLEDGYHRLEVDVMSGQVNPVIFKEVLGEESAEHLFRRWLAHRMIELESKQVRYRLTPNGAWFAGRLLQEVFSYPIRVR
jgi:oxygen-independent coproporphyrinogen-3 oxidase